MIDDLEKSSLFHDLSAEHLTDVSRFCAALSLSDGEMLIEESDENNKDLYLLCSGAVEIVSNSTLLTSNEVVISKEDMDVFGEIAWLTNRKRTASVRCHGSVRAIRVDGQALSDYLNNNSEPGYAVMRRIALTLSSRMVSTDSLLKQILWNTAL